ncbi:hypothetical protein AAG906_010372 [Vitis piasezkii]
MDLNRVDMKRFLDLNEMEELRNDAYSNSNIAKQRLKRWHDQLISRKQFQKGQRVLLYDSRLHIFPGNLKSRWIGPFTIHQVYSNGVSMANVSSHSWSHFVKTRRKSLSLSHIKLERRTATVHRVLPKKSRTSSLGESSRHPQPNSRAPTDSQIPFDIGPESIIKRPMVTVPPIEENSDCRARPFHSELYFDIEVL